VLHVSTHHDLPEDTMQDLIAVAFPGTHRAAEVLEHAQTLDAQGVIDLADAVTVYRSDDGRLRLNRSLQPTSRQGAALGGLVGAILGGVLAAPFTAGGSAAIAAAAVGTSVLGIGTAGAALAGTDAADWKEQYGVPEDFVKEVGGMVQPGMSALFALVHSDATPTEIAKRFRGYGGTVLRTSLTASRAARLQDALSSSRGARA
jgi:uncharacterized membrane protein